MDQSSPRQSCTGETPDAVGHVAGRHMGWVAALVALGLIPRLVEYLHYRPLWSDEAILAAHVLTGSTKDLLGALPDAIAPPGYLVALKYCVAAFGVNEYAVRLPSIVGAVAALFLLYAVAKRLASPLCVVISLAFLAVSEHSIYYAGEVRPYATDAAIGLLLLWFALGAQEGKSPFWPIAFALAGAAAVWLSYPAVFFLAGIGTVLAVLALRRRDWRRLGLYVPMFAVWGGSFLILYLVNIRSVEACGAIMKIAHDQYGAEGAAAFMPFPPRSFADLRWFGARYVMFCDHPAGLEFPGLAGFAFLVGCGALFGKKKGYLYLLLLPLVYALAASGLQKYPFHARTTLYYVPVFYLLIGQGAGYLIERIRGRSALVGAVLLGILLLHPVYRMTRDVAEPRRHHELDRVLDYVQAHWQEGDTLYLPYVPSLTYLFCRHRYHFREGDVLVEPAPPEGQSGLQAFTADLVRLRGKPRVWIAMTYALRPRAEQFWQLIDAFAERGEGAEARGAMVYRYDFSGPPPAPTGPGT